MSKIQSTTDYTLFEILKGNRPLNSRHLRKLSQSIQENNHLDLHPIVVNDKFEVIDGQHRLECARRMNLPIYFVQSDQVADEHLIACNVNQMQFECENYIDFFAQKHQNPHYIKLMELMKLSGLGTKAILSIVIGAVSTPLLNFLRTGKFMFPENKSYEPMLECYIRLIGYLRDKRVTPISMFKTHNFCRAFRWVYMSHGFNETIFFKKLDAKWFELKPQANAEGWYHLLIKLYNLRNNAPLDMMPLAGE